MIDAAWEPSKNVVGGFVGGLVAGLLGRRAIERPLALPRGVAVVTVGGATFGGSGKTRLALACVTHLAARGVTVVLVGHAYRARPGRARVVEIDDGIEVVGDEALACARVIASRRLSVRARVVVAPSRQAAVDHAAALDEPPKVIVIDGPLQLSPARAALSLLAVDAHAPWGEAWNPRASRRALLAAADQVVSVDATPTTFVREGERLPIASLARTRFGLFTALARPERLVRALAREHLAPHVVVHARDHGPLGAALQCRVARLSATVDLWLATPKCATHLLASGLPASAVGILDDEPRMAAGGGHLQGRAQARVQGQAPDATAARGLPAAIASALDALAFTRLHAPTRP